MKNIKWLIAHQPEYLFLRTAKAFAKMLEKVLPEYKIEILTTEQYLKQNPEFTREQIMDLVKKNEVQMSQTEVWELSHATNDENFLVFDMPWLFKDHGHARRVLEGPIGTAINSRLAKQTGVRGLAYTYSGGFRTVGMESTPIKNLSDLADKTVRINGNPITQEYMKKFMNISRVKTPRAGGVFSDLHLPEGVDGKDTTYIRFQNAKSFLKSEHSLFLTDILISDEFFQSLSKEEQDIFTKTAYEAARLERKWSQEDAEQFEATAKERGCEIVELSAEDKETMQEEAKEIYAKWEERFIPGLLDGIAKLQ